MAGILTSSRLSVPKRVKVIKKGEREREREREDRYFHLETLNELSNYRIIPDFSNILGHDFTRTLDAFVVIKRMIIFC